MGKQRPGRRGWRRSRYKTTHVDETHSKQLKTCGHSQCSGQDTNEEPPEWKSDASSLELAYSVNSDQDGQCTYNVPLKRVRVPTVAVEKQ